MSTRILIVPLGLAVAISARAWAVRQDRNAKRAAAERAAFELEEHVRELEFEKHVATALQAVADPDELAQVLQQERIKELITGLLNDWPDPAFGAFCERQFIDGKTRRLP